VRWRASTGPFAGTSEDRAPRVLSAIRPLPCSLRCARERAPVAATRGGKPSEVVQGPTEVLHRTDPRRLIFTLSPHDESRLTPPRDYV